MEAKDILEIYQLSKTSVRLEIISLLRRQDYALTEQEIKEGLSGHYDRTTIYRTLKTFVNQGIAHKIADDNTVVRYVLNKEFTASREYYKEHIHFKCQRCGRLFCLEDVPVKRYSLPEGFTRIRSEFLIVGICRDCNWKAQKEL